MATVPTSAEARHAGRPAPISVAIEAARLTVAAPWQGLLERFRRARRARQTYRALSRLSDRELNDIGLTRGEIEMIAERLAANPTAPKLTITALLRR